MGATLQASFPNPFRAQTRIAFQIEEPGHVDLSVYDLAGRRVATLRNGEFAVGEYEVSWDGRTDTGRQAGAGQYFYVLSTPKGQVSRRMTLLR